MALVLTHGEVPANYARNFAAILDNPGPLVVPCEEIAEQIPGIWTPTGSLQGYPRISDYTARHRAAELGSALRDRGFSHDDPVSIVYNKKFADAVPGLRYITKNVTDRIGRGCIRGAEGSVFSLIDNREWNLDGQNLIGPGANVLFEYPVEATIKVLETKHYDHNVGGEQIVTTTNTHKKTFYPAITEEQRKYLNDLMERQNAAIDEARSAPDFDDFSWEMSGYENTVSGFDTERSIFLRTLG